MWETWNTETLSFMLHTVKKRRLSEKDELKLDRTLLPLWTPSANCICPLAQKNKTKNKPAHSFFFCISPVAEPNVSTFQKFLQTHSFNPITSFQPNPVFARRLSFDCQLIEKNWHCAEEKMPIKHLLHIVQWPAVGSSLGYIWPLFMFS